MPQPNFLRNAPAFMQRSHSIASLVAWKDRFDSGMAGRFAKEATFVSYMSRGQKDRKVTFEEADLTPVVQYAPENDLPPSYPEVVLDNDNDSPPPPPPPDEENEPLKKEVHFQQDFTALENYLKRKLSIRRPNVHSRGRRDSSDMEYETEQVFKWLYELPEGDNLEEFLRAYGIPTEAVDLEDLKNRLRQFLKEKLSGEIVQNESDGRELTSVPKWQRQITSLEELAYDDNLEKWIESLDVPYFRPLPETKDQIRKYLKIQIDDTTEDEIVPPQPKVTFQEDRPNAPAITPKWKDLVERMRDLKNEDELDKWLDSLEVPCNVPKDKVKAELKKFFMHETFESFKGKSVVLQEHTLARELWEKFEGAGVMKQVAMIAGTTAVLGLVAVLSATMLSFAFPAGLSVSPFFNEVFAQYFLQRQEVAFNLLNFHNQNAKPLSTAWAKQYVLWKYC